MNRDNIFTGFDLILSAQKSTGEIKGILCELSDALDTTDDEQRTKNIRGFIQTKRSIIESSNHMLQFEEASNLIESNRYKKFKKQQVLAESIDLVSALYDKHPLLIVARYFTEKHKDELESADLNDFTASDIKTALDKHTQHEKSNE